MKKISISLFLMLTICIIPARASQQQSNGPKTVAILGGLGALGQSALHINDTRKLGHQYGALLKQGTVTADQLLFRGTFGFKNVQYACLGDMDADLKTMHKGSKDARWIALLAPVVICWGFVSRQ